MSKKVLIILAHPITDSFTGSLADAYVKGAKTRNAEIKRINLAELNFDPLLHRAYSERQELEPDLLEAQKDILWANHVVILFPTWWGSYPALLKGFLDRVWLPGFAFKFRGPKTYFYIKLLKGKSARIIVTMDGITPMYRFLWLSPGVNALRHSVLYFSGFWPVRTTYIGYVKMLSDKQRQRRINKIYKLGRGLR